MTEAKAMADSFAHPIEGAKVTPKTPTKRCKENCTLLVLDLLRKGVRPSQIWKNHGVSERSVKLVLRKLQDVGIIKKIGYGTWEVQEGSKKDPRRCKVIHRVGQLHTPQKVQKKVQSLKPNSVRGHGIVATVKIPRFVNWIDRDIILRKRGIEYKEIPQGQRIKVGKVDKVWLTNRPSLVFYFPRGTSWYGETAKEVSGAILIDVIKHVKMLERMLGVDTFEIRGNYHIKFSRQHYALIRNELARMYNKPGEKLQVRDASGLWLIIDNSYNLEELETVHPKTAVDDNKPCQDFFNGLKQMPITPQMLMSMQAETTTQIKEAHGQMAYFAKNLESHVGAIRTLGDEVKNLGIQASENAKTTVSLREAVQRFAEAFQGESSPGLRFERPYTLAPKKVDKTPSEPLASKTERKICGLCKEEQDIPKNKTICQECENIARDFKKEGTLSLSNYMG